MANHNRKITKALTPARQLALRTLLSMQARNEKIQAALNITLAAVTASTDKKDKALCTQLVYGCVRLKIRLDWILDKYLDKPEALPSSARRVMRMAAYELLLPEPYSSIRHNLIVCCGNKIGLWSKPCRSRQRGAQKGFLRFTR
jgi:NusB family.